MLADLGLWRSKMFSQSLRKKFSGKGLLGVCIASQLLLPPQMTGMMAAGAQAAPGSQPAPVNLDLSSTSPAASASQLANFHPSSLVIGGKPTPITGTSA